MKMPNEQVQPANEWDVDTNLFLEVGRKNEIALFKMKYKYRRDPRPRRPRGGGAGNERHHQHQGRPRVATGGGDGRPRAADGRSGGDGDGDGDGDGTNPRRRGVYGVSRGAALVDLAAGSVAVAGRSASSSNVEIRSEPAGREVDPAGRGQLDMLMQRSPVPVPRTPSPSPRCCCCPTAEIYRPVLRTSARRPASRRRSRNRVSAGTPVPTVRTAQIKKDALEKAKKAAVLVKTRTEMATATATAPGGSPSRASSSPTPTSSA